MTDIELYNAAKEAYYNGNPIMEDFEFDALEEKLGLSNKSYIGTRHNPSYTVQHPYMMGSLAKVQIHKNKEGIIEWSEYLAKAQKFFGVHNCIVTPKFDGCSFEIVYEDGEVKSISTRGDGEYGKDIKYHLISHAREALKNISGTGKYCFRGEVLIDKNIFKDKYSEFVNPRSFVAGILNRDFTPEIEDICKDLSIVIYDTKIFFNNDWVDIDWIAFSNKYVSESVTENLYGSINESYLPNMVIYDKAIDTEEFFATVYNKFEEYRNNECQFALDGIVIKPVGEFRINNLTEHRPSDCVAIKFIPMLEETEVVEITWKTGKTNELTPVVVVKPVIMDGKSVTKASGHNYGYLIDKKISVGTKIILSLAGDIIPFIYKITDTSNFNENKLCIPEEYDTYKEGCHLYKVMSTEELSEKSFLISAQTLNVPGIGPAAAKKIYDYMMEESKPDDFFGIEAKPLPTNILMITGNDIDMALGGKLGKTGKKEFEKVLKNLSLKDIILSMGYTFCGGRVAEEIEKYLCGESYDWTSLASEGYDWAVDKNNTKYDRFIGVLNHLNMTIDDFKQKTSGRVENAADQIPVILTGEPNNYLTKQDFLNHHPEYRVTGSWKEVQIVFTNSLESNTGKMKQAREKGIKIELY